jgi:hypothetical protein
MSQDKRAEQHPGNVAFDTPLAELPRVDMPPLAARALRIQAHRRLARAQPENWPKHCEAAFLLSISAAHCCWALFQVLM